MNIPQLTAYCLENIGAATTLEVLEAVRVDLLGKKGKITSALKGLSPMTLEERKAQGPVLNALKDEVIEAIVAHEKILEAQAIETRLHREEIDITLPIRPEKRGIIHPLTRTMTDISSIFGKMGFTVVDGPDIEDDWHNFTALNFPQDHPARDMHDTFFLDKTQGLLLRTHTSPVQIRYLTQNPPPTRIISIGRTYRYDSDATHSPMFHQVEALVIDKGIHMGHLKGCLQAFLQAYFETNEVPMRLRPSFFPFVEPGAEVDIQQENGEWMEILGCGMVHTNVLRHCGIDPNIWQGFAFGAGIERLTMVKHGITDLRPMFQSDPRWLSHYGTKEISACA